MLRLAITGVDAFELDQMLDLDIEVHQSWRQQPTAGTVRVGLGGPPEEIGHNVAAALVGAFFGILLCYRLVGQIAASMTKDRRTGARLALCLARSDGFISERHSALHGARSDAACQATSGPRSKNWKEACRNRAAEEARAAAVAE